MGGQEEEAKQKVAGTLEMQVVRLSEGKLPKKTLKPMQKHTILNKEGDRNPGMNALENAATCFGGWGGLATTKYWTVKGERKKKWRVDQ